MFHGTERPPSAPEFHRWADWAEILAFTAASGTFSVSDLTESIDQQRDAIRADPKSESDAGSLETESLLEHLTADEAQFQDAIRRRAIDVIAYLSNRSERFKEAYPFSVDATSGSLTLLDASPSRNLYVVLLASSALRYVKNDKKSQTSDGSISSELTAHFELIGHQVLRTILPRGSTIKLFGKNAQHASGYEGNLKAKIEGLAKDLGEVVLAKERDINKRDTGDNGLDLVAWMPLGDSLPGRPIFFAQCACTRDWTTKQLSSSAEAWNRTISFISDPTNMVFIPFDYRIPGGEWYTEMHIKKSVVIDRQRILSTLGAIEGTLLHSDVVLPNGLATLVEDSRSSNLLDI